MPSVIAARNSFNPSRSRQRWKIRLSGRQAAWYGRINSLQGHQKRDAVIHVPSPFLLSVNLRTKLLIGQVGQAPSRNRGAARQWVHPEAHREALQFFACQPRKLAEEERNQETESVKSYGGFGTFEPLGPISRKQRNIPKKSSSAPNLPFRTDVSKSIVYAERYDWSSAVLYLFFITPKYAD